MEEKFKILLCEDDENLGTLLSEYLQAKGYQADLCPDGEVGYKTFLKNKYDICVLDVMMPKKDGLTVLKELRNKGNLIPVLLLTAKSEVDDKVEGLDLGANDYLTKPFEPKELLARIRAMTRSKMAEGDSVLEYGNVSLNRESFVLSTKTGEFKLSNKEFQMMELLMSYPKNLISAEKFMEKIWGFDTEADISVVWVYISYLRKKLASLKADIEIKVTRNLGYSLNMAK